MQNSTSILNKQITIIPNKLYFSCADHWPKNDDNLFEFNVDNALEYTPFHEDFGPLKISYIFKYIAEVDKIMKDKQNVRKIFCHLTSTNPQKYINSILLICAFQMIALKKTAQQSYSPFSRYQIIGFRDSIDGKSLYDCPIIQCLKGLQRAVKLNWVDFKTFNSEDYAYYERIENGDINQIIKNSIYAFSSPSDKEKDRFGKKLNSVSRVSESLLKLGVQGIIHLNINQQFISELERRGIENYSMPINDYSCVDTEIAEKFVSLVDKIGTKKIGVHCKTGLGKTGTMIAYYAIKKFQFRAPEIISWIRLCRPGCIVGNQQTFLIKCGQLVDQSVKSQSEKKIESKNQNSVSKRPFSNSQKRETSMQRQQFQLKKKNEFKRRNSINSRLMEGKEQIEKMKKLQSLISKKYQNLLQNNKNSKVFMMD